MSAQLYLRAKDQERLVHLLREYLPGVSALAYGSRVTGRAHEASDLDLALRSPDRHPISVHALSEFRQALSDSNIPILVDAHDWARLPSSFHAEIERQHVALN